jgi:hypothetical protein
MHQGLCCQSSWVEQPAADYIMVIWFTLKKFNLLGRVWQPDPDYNGRFMLLKKKVSNHHYNLQRAATPDQSPEGPKGVEAFCGQYPISWSILDLSFF